MGLRKVLLKHYACYPKMDIQDMVKLIYQNEFAGGHLIENEKASLEFLQRELTSLEKKGYQDSTPRAAIFVDIGNSLCRLHLQSLKKVHLSLETVNKFFINTANSNSGTIDGFLAKLEIFKGCCQEGLLAFPLDEVEDYLKFYEKAGYPPVSHSEVYRANYCPAYRIVKTEYRDYFDVFTTIDSLLQTQQTVIVAIEGNSGAGKSTLANLIASVYDCNLFHMDDFFLTPELKTEERLKETGGNVDYKRFKEEVIRGIQSGKEFQYQVYDCQKMKLREKVVVHPKKLNIIEGSYSMHPTLQDYYHLKIFMAIGEKEQSARILKRNGPVMHKVFLEKWIPLENEYFEKMKIKEKCDLIYSIP